MGIYGVDLHPQFQAGIGIEEIRREGFDFMAVKVSEGFDGSYLAAGSADSCAGAAPPVCYAWATTTCMRMTRTVKRRYSPRPSAPPEYPGCSMPRPLPLMGACRP